MSLPAKGTPETESAPTHVQVPSPAPPAVMPPEFGGRPGPDPTRFGDWEKNGRCIDF